MNSRQQKTTFRWFFVISFFILFRSSCLSKCHADLKTTAIVYCASNWNAQYRHTVPVFPKKYCTDLSRWNIESFQIELFHDQLPLAVPCYDLLFVIELTLMPHTWRFGYSQLPWVDGRYLMLCNVTITLLFNTGQAVFPHPRVFQRLLIRFFYRIHLPCQSKF